MLRHEVVRGHGVAEGPVAIPTEGDRADEQQRHEHEQRTVPVPEQACGHERGGDEGGRDDGARQPAPPGSRAVGRERA